MRHTLLTTLLLLCATTTFAEVTLPAVIGDNAVLQQNETVKLWGTATPKSKLTITPSWDNQQYTTTADKSGKWCTDVATTSAGGPYTITFNDGQELKISNVMLGEVWFCFGQSNMRLPIGGMNAQPVEGAADAIMLADESIPVRNFRSAYSWSFKEEESIGGSWRTNSPQNVGGFGAAAYFFALYLNKALKVPVGIVQVSWGGSSLEGWMSEEMLNKHRTYDFDTIRANPKPYRPQRTPSLIYNGVLSPLKNLKFKGALWYQGESNVNNELMEYPDLFKTMIETLRTEHFDCGEFPVYYSQLAPMRREKEVSEWTLLNEQMPRIMKILPRSGMICLADIGDEHCIHPRRKREVGERFAYWALGDTYGRAYIDYRCPEYRAMEILSADDKNPARIAISFDHVPQSLITPTNNKSVNFEIAGEDRVFYPAEIDIKFGRDKSNQITVWSEEVSAPVAVRYGFKDWFVGDLYNTFGVPVPAFRTDDWEVSL